MEINIYMTDKPASENLTDVLNIINNHAQRKDGFEPSFTGPGGELQNVFTGSTNGNQTSLNKLEELKSAINIGIKSSGFIDIEVDDIEIIA